MSRQCLLLLSVGFSAIAGGGHWSPEYSPPPTVETAARAAEELAVRQWPKAPFKLTDWVRQSMVDQWLDPGLPGDGPLSGPQHLRRGLQDPRVRQRYWHVALAETLRTLATLHPTAGGRADFARLAGQIESQRPDFCRGPPGNQAVTAWKEEAMRFHDALGGSPFVRAKAALRETVAHQYSAGEALGRCMSDGCVYWTPDTRPSPGELAAAAAMMVAVALMPVLAEGDALQLLRVWAAVPQ